MEQAPSLEQLTGCDDSQIDRQILGVPVHRAMVEDFQALQGDAREAGFDLAIASGFRDFQRQLLIWNGKAGGQRPLLDSEGLELTRTGLSDWERVQAILRWSALPGASRHHWGCDIDVFDAAAVPEGYRVQLTPAEVADEGMFGPFHQWLDRSIERGESHGFFRPYGEDRGGIAPERWHLSYAPLACLCQASLGEQGLRDFLSQQGDLALWSTVEDHWDEVYRRYIWVPGECYPEPFQERLRGSQCSR